MKPKTRIILLCVISILIVTVLTLGITYSYMKAQIDVEPITEVTLSSCAKITLQDNGVSIDLSNSYPMSKNRALETTPYTFTVASSCESYVGFDLYLATLGTNTLGAENIHYIITNVGTTDIIAEGILSEADDVSSEFTSSEQAELRNGIGGSFNAIYKLYSASIPLQGSVSYDLYLYIDEDVTDESTMNETFNAGIAVKSYDRVYSPFSEACNDNTLACRIAQSYSTDGGNDLYYHDGEGTYGSLEAGDNSYRYSGADPDNYVCFGSDAETCPYDNLYRIIGLFDDDEDEIYNVKLIKADYATTSLLGTNGDYYNTYEGASLYEIYQGDLSLSDIGIYYWNYSSAVSVWSDSQLYEVNLNTNYIAYLNAINVKWTNMIGEYIWQVGGMTVIYGRDSNAQTAYNYEVGSGANGFSVEAKIGLMYASDYYYAATPTYWTYPGYSSDGADYSAATDDNWMYMGLYEWTISPASNVASGDGAFNVTYTGYVYSIYVTSGGASAVRPVFYLKSSVEYVSGNGTSDDPYRIAY